MDGMGEKESTGDRHGIQEERKATEQTCIQVMDVIGGWERKSILEMNPTCRMRGKPLSRHEYTEEKHAGDECNRELVGIDGLACYGNP